MGEIQIRAVRPGEYGDTGSLTQRAYAEYARPGEPLWDSYFGMLPDVASRARCATVLVAVVGERIVGTATVEARPDDRRDRRPAARAGQHPGCWPWIRGSADVAWAGGW